MTLNFIGTVLVAVVGPVTALARLWLRLVWRTRHEQARRKTLVDLVKALRQECELEEHGPDGTRLRIIARARKEDASHDAGDRAGTDDRHRPDRTVNSAAPVGRLPQR